MYHTDEDIGKEINLGYRNFLLIDIMKAIFYELETMYWIKKTTDEITHIKRELENLKKRRGK